MGSTSLRDWVLVDRMHVAMGQRLGCVTSAADYEAVNAALGRVIASVPPNLVMDVYIAFAGLVSPTIPNYLFQGVNALDANAAAKAFCSFMDVGASSLREG